MPTPITTSVFDLFKIGPGPSSSHTIGPMKAAFDFRERLARLPDAVRSSVAAVQIHLYGSLSATGKGHGTDRAIVGGLLGWQPATCDPKALLALLKNPGEKYPFQLPDVLLAVGADDIRFHRGQHAFPHPNTLILKAVDAAGTVLLEEEYYSVGGGFVVRKGEVPGGGESRPPRFPYSTFRELTEQVRASGLTLPQVLVGNEKDLTGRTEREIYDGLDAILRAMHQSVKRGLRTKGVLPGSIRLGRKAPLLFERAQKMAIASDSFLLFLNAYCLAASEENAAGGIVVTAPTSGASGVFPGLTFLMKTHFHLSPQTLRDGLLVGAAIGFLVKHNASISGAEMGCMGEIGTASAMGAAMLTHALGGSLGQVEAAAEIGIEHHLGMTCDPIGGYVQIPCIERNAMGAAKAYNAYLLAISGDPAQQKISFDNVVKVMRATGRDMSKKYKETSEAGLALSATEC